MKIYLRSTVSLIACASIGIVGACDPASETKQDWRANLPEISGERALKLLEEFLAIGPRPSGSEGAAAAARWIAQEARRRGADVNIDEWREETAAGAMTFRNVAATLPGNKPGRIILGSHYDTKNLPGIPDFQGANDSGSSTALLLMLITALDSIPAQERCTLEFVFFDGEECIDSYGPKDGLHGSRYHARRIKNQDAVDECRAMILLDMVGDRDLRITIPPESDSKLARELFAIAERQGVREQFGYFQRGSILDDHVPFAELGIPAINLIDFDYGPGNSYWHTAEDTIDKISAASLHIVGNVALELAAELAVQDMDE